MPRNRVRIGSDQTTLPSGGVPVPAAMRLSSPTCPSDRRPRRLRALRPGRLAPVEGFDLTDVTYHRAVVDGPGRGTVRVAFDRPEVRNAFRPHTVDELFRVLDHARR